MKKYTISLGEKIRFGFSDIGVNLAFYMITSYFMLYLTDVVGLPSKIVGTIFLIAMRSMTRSSAELRIGPEPKSAPIAPG